MSNSINWLDQCYRRVYISQHYESWESRTFEQYDVSDMIQIIESTDPSFVLITARTHNGMWFCDVGWGTKFAPLHGVDELQAFIDHFQAKGVRVVAYVSAAYDKEMFDIHEDWRQVTSEGEPVSKRGGSWGQVVCLNSPYREYMVEMVSSLVKSHSGLDGVFFDMTFFEEKPCYCTYCRKAFHERFALELPSENWDDPVYRKFNDFRIETNRIFIRDICAAVKRNAPHMSTGVQCQIMLNSRSMTSQTIASAKIPDYLYFDPYISSGFLLPSVATRLASAISHHLPEISLITRPGNHNDNPNMKPIAHLRMDAFTAIANGGSVQFFDVMWSNGTLQKAMWERIGYVFSDIKAREPWLGGMPYKSVAVYYSEITRFHYGQRNNSPVSDNARFNAIKTEENTHSSAGERYDQHFHGLCRALLEEHIPWNPIISLDAETLNGYQVLVLPNTACLSDKEAESIRDFVNNGGGLIASGRTSLYDEVGERLPDFRLSDVLGINYDSDTSAYSRVYSRFIMPCPLADLPADGLMTNWGTSQRVVVTSAKALAYITYPYTEATSKRFLNIMVNPPAVDTDWPAVTINTYGKGKVIYFSGEIEKNYLHLSFPELRKIIVGAINTVSKKSLQIQLQAPKSVELSVYNQPDKSRIICHLINYQPEIGRPVIYNGFESRHIIDEVLPVHDISLKMVIKDEPKSVMLQPMGEKCAFRYENKVLTIDIPVLEQHAMVVIDY